MKDNIRASEYDVSDGKTQRRNLQLLRSESETFVAEIVQGSPPVIYRQIFQGHAKLGHKKGAQKCDEPLTLDLSPLGHASADVSKDWQPVIRTVRSGGRLGSAGAATPVRA